MSPMEEKQEKLRLWSIGLAENKKEHSSDGSEDSKTKKERSSSMEEDKKCKKNIRLPWKTKDILTKNIFLHGGNKKM